LLPKPQNPTIKKYILIMECNYIINLSFLQVQKRLKLFDRDIIHT